MQHQNITMPAAYYAGLPVQMSSVIRMGVCKHWLCTARFDQGLNFSCAAVL